MDQHRQVPRYGYRCLSVTIISCQLNVCSCPGSVMFVFAISSIDESCNNDTRYFLHTGDFRASRELIDNPILSKLAVHYDAVYLDTTYCDPEYVFPAQEKVILECCRVVDRLVNKHDARLFSPICRLILIGSYLVGKEKIAVAIAKLLGSKIYCSNRKRMVLGCLEWPELMQLLTDEPTEARIHLVLMRDLETESIGAMLNALWPRYTHALAIRPTGWTFGPSPANGDGKLTFANHTRRDNHGQVIRRKDAIAVYATPYSEHSSFAELTRFLQASWLSYSWIIPTVDNPFDNYLRCNDFTDPRQLLSAWHSVRSSTSKPS